MNAFFCILFVSILFAYGMAITLVEKGDVYPIKFYKIKLRKFIRFFSRRFDKVLYCTTCTSFWTSLISDIILCLFFYFKFDLFYFFWPISGFITVGFSWTIIELLNALDKSNN